MNTVRWNIAVSPDTDQSVRSFLASQGSGDQDQLSHFIEEAVRAHILELSADQAKASNRDTPESEIEAIVGEAVRWARKH